MARLQWCRKHIKEVAQACDLSTNAVKEVETVAAFCDTHDAFASLPTRPIITLIRVRDEQVRERAIIKCSERLNGKMGAGRGNTKELTEKDIKKIIEQMMKEADHLFELEKTRSEKRKEATQAKPGEKIGKVSLSQRSVTRFQYPQ